MNKTHTYINFFFRLRKYLFLLFIQVSPADCTVLSYGSRQNNTSNDLDIDQVKGLTYPISTFVGPQHQILKELKSGIDCIV